MSEEQLKAFLEKVKSDTELQEKLKASGSNEAAIQIAKDSRLCNYRRRYSINAIGKRSVRR